MQSVTCKSMAAVKTEIVLKSVGSILKKHGLEDQVGPIDEIVLTYVISILEDLGDCVQDEEGLNVDEFVEMMDAYIPGFGDIPSAEVYEWMFELAGSLSTEQRKGTENTPIEAMAALSLDCVTFPGAQGGQTSDIVINSAGESERSTSESSDDVQVDEQLQMLIEMFPRTLKVEIEHCYSIAEGDVERAAQIVLVREENGTAIKVPPKTTSKKKSHGLTSEVDQKSKELLMAKYAYIDEAEDKKTHKPVAPKAEPKKLVRYLDSKVVNIKGNKFTDMKKEDSDEMKKTYINLKPAKQYRFH